MLFSIKAIVDMMFTRYLLMLMKTIVFSLCMCLCLAHVLCRATPSIMDAPPHPAGWPSWRCHLLLIVDAQLKLLIHPRLTTHMRGSITGSGAPSRCELSWTKECGSKRPAPRNQFLNQSDDPSQNSEWSRRPRRTLSGRAPFKHVVRGAGQPTIATRPASRPRLRSA
jgi:hypothetical protein